MLELYHVGLTACSKKSRIVLICEWLDRIMARPAVIDTFAISDETRPKEDKIGGQRFR